MFHWPKHHHDKGQAVGNMTEHGRLGDRVAVLVDCDNASPEILEYAMGVGARFGNVVLRRGYGSHATLANKWQRALIRHAFSPCLQYQYAAGKNTSDIALALDALDDLFERRADIYCLVTSDSDFVYLCRKLRERGATVCIVGEGKTPDALRYAGHHFFELPQNDSLNKKPAPLTAAKRQPRALLSAIFLLAADTAEGWVSVAALGQHMRETDPDFTAKKYGHAGLQKMILTYPELEARSINGACWVKPKIKAEVKEPDGGQQALAV